MKRKLLPVLLGILMIACFSVGLAACNNNDRENDGSAGHEHTLVYHEANEPTCTEDGNIEYWTCSECGKLFSDAEGNKEISEESYFLIPAAHKLVYHAPKIESCTEDGNKEYWECEACGKYFADEIGSIEISDKNTVIIAAHHNLNYISAKPASCTEDGNIEYWECITCGMYFEDEACKKEITDKNSVILVGHHELNHYAAVQATCTEGGNIEYWQCKNCYAMFSDAEGKIAINTADTLALGHDMEWIREKSATCTQDGTYGHYRCARCEKLYWDGNGGDEITSSDAMRIPASGHETQRVDRRDATCTQDGNKEYWTCSQCGGIFADSEGQTPLTEEDIIIRAPGHVLAYHAAQGSTCTAYGNIEYWECTVCYKEFTDAEAVHEVPQSELYIPMKEHNFSDTYVSDEFSHWRECTVCKTKQNQGNHIWNDSPKSACSVCGFSLGYTYGLEFLSNEDGYSVKAGDGFDSADVVIPAAYRGKPVTEIAERAFSGCTALRTISIPDSIIRIDGLAFEDCTSLQQIVLPDSVQEVGFVIFSGCTALSVASMPAIAAESVVGCGLTELNITSGERIEDWTFENMLSLEKIALSPSLNFIGTYAFMGCSNLKEVHITDLSAWCTMNFEEGGNPLSIGAMLYLNGQAVTALDVPADVSAIGTYAFDGYKALTQVNLPAGLAEIGQNAFRNCSAIESITIPASVQRIGDYAFSGCDALTELVLEEGVGKISAYALADCPSLNGIVIPDSATCDGTLYFSGCAALETVVIGDGIQSFSGLENNAALREVMIGDGVTQIYVNMFRSCTALETVEFGAGVSGEIGVRAFAYCTSLREIWIPSEVTSLGNYAFQGCSSLEKVYLTRNIGEIGDSAFAECASLQIISLQEGLTSIGSRAFLACKMLKKISIPYTVREMGDGAFRNCSSLTEVSISADSSLESIPYTCFYECVALEKISFGKNIKNIGGNAFTDCGGIVIDYLGTVDDWCTIEGLEALTGNLVNYEQQGDRVLYIDGKEIAGEIVISEKAAKIAAYAFQGCDLITKVTISDSVQSIGENAFYGCTSLIAAELPEGLTTIENETFYGCTSLATIFLPNTVTSIGDRAFFGCETLHYAALSSSLQTIGNSAFANCFRLGANGMLVVLDYNVKSIGSNAFSCCLYLTDIYIPKNVEQIGANAFSVCYALTIRCEVGEKPAGWDENWNKTSSTDTDCPVVWGVGFGQNGVADDGYIYIVEDNVRYRLKDGEASLPDQSLARGDIVIKEQIIYLNMAYTVRRIEAQAFLQSETSTLIVPSSITFIGDHAFPAGDILTKVYYCGSQDEWQDIKIGNMTLSEYETFYYSKEDPFGGETSLPDGNYWHYDTDGKTPVIWTKETA